jgi:cytochrome c556
MLNRLAARGVVLVALASVMSLTAQASAEDKLAAFMKAKLEHSEKVLEGLAREDYDLIAKHSTAISLLCEDELWSVLQTPEYVERSKEFRRSVYAITEAARKKNLEAAAFAYVDSTMKCVSCHKYVRQTRKP